MSVLGWVASICFIPPLTRPGEFLDFRLTSWIPCRMKYHRLFQKEEIEEGICHMIPYSYSHRIIGNTYQIVYIYIYIPIWDSMEAILETDHMI